MFESSALLLSKLGIFSIFTMPLFTQQYNDYLAIDGGGNVGDSVCTETMAWTNASQRSRAGVGMNRRSVNCKAL